MLLKLPQGHTTITDLNPAPLDPILKLPHLLSLPQRLTTTTNQPLPLPNPLHHLLHHLQDHHLFTPPHQNLTTPITSQSSLGP